MDKRADKQASYLLFPLIFFKVSQLTNIVVQQRTSVLIAEILNFS